MEAKEIQRLYNEYKRLEKITDEIDERAMAYMEGEELAAYEAKWDKAYQQEWFARMNLINALQRLGINFNTAKAMIASDEFEQLMGLQVI